MKEQVSQILYAYWNGVRAGRIAPRRFEIEPSCLAAVLPDTFILESLDAEAARFRLAGTRICEAFGSELRGSNFFDLFAPEERLGVQMQFANIAEQGAVGVLKLEAFSAQGRRANFEMTVLPLLHTRDVIDRYLGSIAPDTSYPWFGSDPIVSQRLLSFELVWPDGRPHAVIERSRNQAPFLAHVRAARIVKSDRRNFRVYEGGRTNSGNDPQRR